MRANPQITIPELSAICGVTDRTIERNIQKLRDEGHVYRSGAAKGGYWEVSS